MRIADSTAARLAANRVDTGHTWVFGSPVVQPQNILVTQWTARRAPQAEYRLEARDDLVVIEQFGPCGVAAATVIAAILV